MMRVLQLWMPGLASAVVGLLLGTFIFDQAPGGLVPVGGFGIALAAAAAIAGLVSLDDTRRPYFTNSSRTGGIAAIAQSPDRLGRALVRMYTRTYFPVTALAVGVVIFLMVISTGLLGDVSWPLPNETQLGAAYVIAMAVMVLAAVGLIVVGTIPAALGTLSGFVLGVMYVASSLSSGGGEEIGWLIISALAGLIAVSIGIVVLVRLLVRRRRARASESSDHAGARSAR